ncbi:MULTISPECIES: 2-polyprenyl-3-methyl-6-methoxy-1,4-benzoquinone monooxygenase [Gulbenkiania]|uniref:3-demethoxyubiquinol 3-hydroxylase n=2 Tax=Gulbenkiania TaxID=397456 RepID=A0A0K6H5X9_9NEIS|nr:MULTISPECIES: 2-polyprenyl-3-methyl-6-methoxy-1,4-benzoquinone monooxygenase [Gulbenkiania]TCW33656.1 ubiquinone biosynthesis monooxygenase Coq7 [Gulbenkiania mobilis]CUA86395.1 Demethoxyubiquinone hydroxylase, CLK1/Coq7/Cat5 family [Gulbenkiania indica]
MFPDSLIVEFDRGLRTLFASATSARSHPDAGLTETELSDAERRHALGLMRVNHCGEVCAQALYQGQALTARNPAAREALRHAAFEEVEHLAWTEKRIRELGGRTSVFNPLWYTGSLAIGVAAGVLGDKWNLGFLRETEHQVGAHLDSHLQKLPLQDEKSRAIVAQMRDDELKHADMAEAHGAARLPLPVRAMMKLSAKVMTGTSYYV